MSGAANGRVMRPGDDPRWTSYAETILIVHSDPPVDIDLGHPVAPAIRERLSRAGLGGRFAILTPCNPRGRNLSGADNHARLSRFLAELDLGGKRYVRVDGVSRDHQHVEPGVAVCWSQEDAVALARKWEQSAIYWWDGDAFWVIGALVDSSPWRLGNAG